ncbi:MAG: prepilin-type N-terminal cleavage/methylation domain-containing protein [bacterium]
MKKGFTLIEILVVISIIAVLSSIVLAYLNTSRQKAINASKIATVRSVNQGIQLFSSNTGAVPGNYNVDGAYNPGGGGDTPACGDGTDNASDQAYNKSMKELVDGKILPQIPKALDDNPYCYYNYGDSEGSKAVLFTKLSTPLNNSDTIYPTEAVVASGGVLTPTNIYSGGGSSGGGSVILGTITGTIELQGFIGTGTNPLHTRSITFTATFNGVSVKSWTIPLTNLSGSLFSFTLTDVPLDANYLSAKTDWSLRRRLPFTLSNNQATLDFTGTNLLLGGDLDGSNLVDDGDFNIVISNLGTTNSVADINGDGVVNTFDRSRVLNVIGKFGDPL